MDGPIFKSPTFGGVCVCVCVCVYVCWCRVCVCRALLPKTIISLLISTQGMWSCTTCTYNNSAAHGACAMCEAEPRERAWSIEKSRAGPTSFNPWATLGGRPMAIDLCSQSVAATEAQASTPISSPPPLKKSGKSALGQPAISDTVYSSELSESTGSGTEGEPEISAAVPNSELCESTVSGTDGEPCAKRARERLPRAKSLQRTTKARSKSHPGPAKTPIDLCAQSGLKGVTAVAEALASRPPPLKTYGSRARNRPEANATVSSSDMCESSASGNEEEPCAKRGRGRLPLSKSLQRTIKARDARIVKLNRRIKALQSTNVQLQRRLDTRPPTALGHALRSLTKTKNELLVTKDSLSVHKIAKESAQSRARVLKHRKTVKVDAQRKLIRSLQRSRRRTHATKKSKKKTKKRTRKKVVGEVALRKREKAMATLVGEQFDELCEEFDVGSRRLGLVMTRDGGSATIVAEPAVTVPDDTGLDRWDPIDDRLLGRAVFIVDQKTIPIDSYRATQSLSSGVAPNAHRVVKGKEALDISIEDLGVSIEMVGLDEHKHDAPSVVTTVSGLLGALDKSQMYLPSQHTHTHITALACPPLLRTHACTSPAI
jgi:hypothetical protein